MVFQRFKCPIRRAGYVSGDVQNRPWINSYSVFVQIRCDGNLMKFYTTLSSSFRSNIWIIFPQKEKFLSRLATFFFPSFSLSPFFLFLSERERLSVFFERTNTIDRTRRFEDYDYRSRGARSRSGRPRQMRRRSHVKTEGTFLSPCWLPPRNDFVRLCAGLRGDIRRIRLIKSKDPSRSGEPRRVTKQLKRRINCDRTPGKISP